MRWLIGSLAALCWGLSIAEATEADKGIAPDGDMRIAVAGPLTRGNAVFGIQMKQGVEQAVADINAAGGVLARKLAASFADDRSQPEEGAAVARKLAADGVKFVVGHFNSGISIPASNVYRDSDMLMLTPASSNPLLTKRKLWNVFRTCGRDDDQGLLAGEYITKLFRTMRVAVVHDNTAYGLLLTTTLVQAMNVKGMREVLFEGVNHRQKDFSAVVAMLKAARADLVYWGGLHDAGGLLLRQMRDGGVNARFMGADGIASDEFAASAGPAAEGTLMTFPPDPRTRAVAREVVAKFRAKGFEPEAYTLYSYAAVQVIKQAAEAVGSFDTRSMAAEIHSGRTFKTVLGDLSYDRKGDITKLDYLVYVWKKGKDGKIWYF
jgi:branched-chain amino acid transport system substrate-binding protein